MLDSGLISKNFIGRDGFIWWIGQVPDAKVWKGNIPTLPQNSPADLPGFQYRVKVRILGYHTSDLTTLSDEELPWALVMLPTTAGSGSGGNATTPRFSGGEFVFGFFLDGDNGQQPVVIGHLGNSTQTILSKSIPSIGFKPFSGYTSTGKQVPSHSQLSPKEVEKNRIQGGTNSSSIPSGSSGNAPNITVSATIPDLAKSVSQEGTNSTGDIKSKTQVNQQEDNKEYILANACKKDKKKKSKIKSSIKNLIKSINGMQRSYDKYIRPTANEIANITAEIRKCAGLINGFIQDQINDFRTWLFNEIKKRVEKQLGKTSTKKQTEAGEILQEVVDNIGCVFDKIMDALFDVLVDFLTKMLDKILNAAQCVIDNMVGALLDSIVAPLESALSSILSPLNSFLGAASSGLEQALDFAGAIDRFLSCEKEDPCPEVEVWSWLDGPKPSEEDNYSTELRNIRSTPSTSLSNFLGNPSNIPPSAGSIGECLIGPGLCGPPIIQLFGGGGIGAAANAIIGSSGEILAVDLLNPGINYYSNPFIYFDDNCGNGSGAKAECIVDCGKIIDIKVIDGGKGYLKRPNGSLGSSGVTMVGVKSDANALILPSGADFTINSSMFEFSKLSEVIKPTSGISTSIPETGIEIPCGEKPSYPSIPISVLPGSTIGIPSGCAIIKSPSIGELETSCKFTKSGNTYTFQQDCVVTIPPVSLEIDTDPDTSTIDDYSVVLELDDVVIRNTGINYSPDDKICITPDNGAKLEPQFDPYGRLVDVRILNKGTFVTERPSITICNTKTGINADMFAVLKVKQTTKEEAQKLGQDKIISVIDCVGKVNG